MSSKTGKLGWVDKESWRGEGGGAGNWVDQVCAECVRGLAERGTRRGGDHVQK